MFAFPLSKMVGGIFYEHGHRMIASIVGMMTIGLAVWLWRVEPRRWKRQLGLVALATVILQGLLGGIHRPLFPADAGLGLARRSGGNLLLPDRLSRPVHLRRLA